MISSRRRTRTALSLGGIALMLTSACGGGDATGPLEPGEPQAEWVVHELASVSVSTPTTWQEADGAQSDTSQNLQLRGGDPTADDSPVVNITVVPEPERDLAAEVAGVRATVTASFGVKDFAEEELTWPGAAESTYLAYVGDQPGADSGTVSVRSEWLFAALEDGTQVLAVVSSPEEGFDDADLHAILATIELPA